MKNQSSSETEIEYEKKAFIQKLVEIIRKSDSTKFLDHDKEDVKTETRMNG